MFFFFFFSLLLLAFFFFRSFFSIHFFFSCLYKARPPGPSALFQKGKSEWRKEALLLLKTWEGMGRKRSEGVGSWTGGLYYVNKLFPISVPQA